MLRRLSMTLTCAGLIGAMTNAAAAQRGPGDASDEATKTPGGTVPPFISVSDAITPPPGPTPVLYVDADRVGGSGPGANWETAFRNVQDALYFARERRLTVGEVRIAGGTYRTDDGWLQTPGDRAAAYVTPAGLLLRGGYAGIGAADPNARDFIAHETVLTGDLLSDDGPDFANTADNAYCVIETSDPGAAVTLDGLTIASGNRFGDAGPNGTTAAGVRALGAPLNVVNCLFHGNRGGAIHVEGDMLTIIDSDFMDNSAGVSGVVADIVINASDFIGHDSPAVFIDTGDLTVTDCLFQSNRNSAVTILYSDAVITGCDFDGNTTNGLNGAGIYATLLGPNSVDMTDCTFTNNIAVNGDGGGVYTNAGRMSLINCDFTGNIATNGGGALVSRGDVHDCTFIDNTATEDGGGLFSEKNDLVNCEFRGNMAGRDGGGAFSSDGQADPSVYFNCVFADNHTTNGDGGGLNIARGDVFNCIFTGNTASHRGGGIRTRNAARVRNIVVVGNNAGLEFNGAFLDSNCSTANSIFWGNNGPLTEDNCNRGNGNTNYCLVQGYDLDPEFEGVGIIDADPLFTDADGSDDIFGTADDDFTLLAGSPCIDAGDNLATIEDSEDLDSDGNDTEFVPFDFLGAARFIDDPGTTDTGAGTAPIIDMGPFEFIPPAPAVADLNRDGVVDRIDLEMALKRADRVDRARRVVETMRSGD